MTEDQKTLFDKLSAHRSKIADALEDPCVTGLADSAADKYTDQAHFVYELIQNADDVGATKAVFELFPDKLVFTHNGKRHFEVSDVDNEAYDAQHGLLKDVNAITSYANSSKIKGNTIGRFGLGFKAVLQYTTEPHIYDKYYCFKIIRRIVPVLIEEDSQYKKNNQTTFVFPFNISEISQSDSYNAISNKLIHLVNPMLFLNSLESISYKIGDISGTYRKNIIDKEQIEGTECDLFQLTNGHKKTKERVWIFSRIDRDEGRENKYSVGFFVDESNKLVIKDLRAFCFFPTAEKTNLSFIIHAPFLLNDSRTGIKAAEPHNNRMVTLLAKLSADCFVYLKEISIKRGYRYIDDDILSYIPYCREKLTSEDESSEISFAPFYDRILEKFSEEKIIPSYNEYCYAKNANLASSLVISSLFSNEQLGQLCKNNEARWAFASVNWDAVKRLHNGQDEYLRKLIPSVFDTIDSILKLIDIDFVAEQNIEWLPKLYAFLCENNQRIERYQSYPIFLDSDMNPVSAYDEWGNRVLFLADGKSEGYTTINEDLYKNEETKKILHFLGIGQPELKDRVYNKILIKESFDGCSDFQVLLDYYIQLKENGENTESYIRDIRYKSFMLCTSPAKTEKAIHSPAEIYFDDENLNYYLKNIDNAWVFDTATYYSILTPKEKMYLEGFLQELGLSQHVRRISINIEKEEALNNYPNETFDTGTREQTWIEYGPQGIEYVLDRIFDNQDIALSKITWNELCQYFLSHKTTFWSRAIGGLYKWFYFSDRSKSYVTLTENKLKTQHWLLNSQNEWVAPADCSLQELNKQYDTSSEGAKLLIDYLEIKDDHPEYEQLSPELREKVELFDKLKSFGLDQYSDDDIHLMTKWLESQKRHDPTEPTPKDKTPEENVIDELTARVKKPKSEKTKPQVTEPEPIFDSDSNNPITVECQKKIEQAKKKCEEEISKIAQLEEAQKQVAECEKYTYGWFSGLLELEAIANGENDTNSREVSISFSKVEPDETQTRTLFLRQPNKNIPPVMEQLINIPMFITMRDGTHKQLIIEAIGIQSYALQVIVKQDDWINSVDWNDVTDVSINTKDTSFLIREMQNEFQRLSFEKAFNMRDNLCDNIRFIFGPPGTGKTTYLANQEIIPLITSNDKLKILVLAPTNKAADVLTERIEKSMGTSDDYVQWLIRYGATGSQSIEESPIYYGKDVDFSSRNKSVVITTMARLPYDYFIESNGDSTYLHDIEWDYVIVDEASMVPLYQMIYMLYRIKPKEFIVAGDPFQIEPTVEMKDWKTENIYTMVKLKEFSDNVETVPHKFKIKLLTTQYRSIASVGEVFSQLTYNGVLKHARSDEDIRPLNIEKYLGEYQSLNLIRFPVNQYEGIYRAKRLKFSNYQIYSALFAYEFTLYLSKALSRCNNDNEKFSIGIIAPYGAQAGLISKLLSESDIPKSISVNCDTIHGFQGDECDIVLALFNPPPKITTNEQMFLNRQNIINVAISRAKDYLFVLMPDDSTENIQNLTLINDMKSKIEKSNYNEYSSAELEELLFGISTYLESNSFETGHQLVNVYGEPQKRYEIRSEESAIDVQVHGTSEYLPFWSEDSEKMPPTENEMKDMLLNQKVFHSKFGNGIILGFQNTYIEIDFSDSKHKFLFPDSLKTHLLLLDESVKQSLKEYFDSCNL